MSDKLKVCRTFATKLTRYSGKGNRIVSLCEVGDNGSTASYGWNVPSEQAKEKPGTSTSGFLY
jgi:hypothetical protein